MNAKIIENWPSWPRKCSYWTNEYDFFVLGTRNNIYYSRITHSPNERDENVIKIMYKFVCIHTQIALLLLFLLSSKCWWKAEYSGDVNSCILKKARLFCWKLTAQCWNGYVPGICSNLTDFFWLIIKIIFAGRTE